MALRRGSFWFKLALIALSVAVADVALFQAKGLGANVGVVGLAWTAALALATPAVFRHRLSRLGLAAATLMALLQFERPTPVGVILYVFAMGLAALAPRAPRGEDAWRWAQRLIAGAVLPLAGPFLDLARLRRARARSQGVRLVAVAAAVALPVVGGLVFAGLFAAANPVIADLFGGWAPRPLDVGRIVFWAVIAFPVWVVLRPRGLRRTWTTPGLDRDFGGGSFAGPASIVASLALFNVIFAVQNGLDIAYLWSGAGLPDGMSFSAYAHRGAEPLIATALLAGLFVVVFLRPGSASAASRPVRILVSVWVAQNLFLVASTALRTLDYVGAYSLTNLRIAALVWMALVAVGLVLILWRLLRARSSSWLLNANVAAVGVVLAACSVVDFSAVTARWNVRHAREVGGAGVALDDAYLSRLGAAAIVPLAELEARSADPVLRARARRAREQALEQVGQGDWRSWRWRDARRLARVEVLLAETVPLTPEANPRT